MQKVPKLFKYSAWTIVVLLLLGIAFRLALGPLTLAAIDRWFAQQGLESGATDISFELQDGNLTLSGLHAGNVDGQLLKLEQARVSWSWPALLDGELRVDSIVLDGLEFGIEMGAQGRLVIAGVDLQRMAAQQAPSKDTETGEPLQWTLSLGDIEVNDFRLCLDAAQQKAVCQRWQQLAWDGRVSLDLARIDAAALPLLGEGDLRLTQLVLEDSATADQLLKLDELAVSGISISASESGGNILQVGSILLDGLDFDIEQGHEDKLVIAGLDLQGLAALQAPASAEPPPAPAKPLPWTLLSGDIAVNRLELCYSAPPRHRYCERWQKLGWNGEISLDLARVGEAVLPLSVNGALELGMLSVVDQQFERELLGIDALAITGVAVNGLDAIEAGKIEIDALAFLERSGETEQNQISFVQKLEVDRLQLQKLSHLDIAEIRIQDHQVLLLKRAEHGLEIEDWLDSFSGEEADSPSADEAGSPAREGDAQATPFSFALARLQYNTSKSIVYQDLSLDQPFTTSLNDIVIEIENLDSRKPEQSSQLRYSARFTNHATIELEGEITPFTEKYSFDLAGRIEGLDLRELSAFTVASIGHRIRSGQLDADLTLRARDDILDSEIDLTLYQLNFSAVSEADRAKVDKSLGFPLNTSLALLKDKENRIQLNIPVTGNLRDPNISPEESILQSVTTAITTTVLTFYTPYGLIPLAGGVLDLATALRFDPVIFEHGSSDVDDIDLDRLDKLLSLMQEKPGVHLTLCPYTNAGDRIELISRSAAIEPGSFVPNASQQQKLEQLGEARAAAVKKLLVEKGIEQSRLVLCSSEHLEVIKRTGTGEGSEDSIVEGIAGVEISI